LEGSVCGLWTCQALLVRPRNGARGARWQPNADCVQLVWKVRLSGRHVSTACGKAADSDNCAFIFHRVTQFLQAACLGSLVTREGKISVCESQHKLFRPASMAVVNNGATISDTDKLQRRLFPSCFAAKCCYLIFMFILVQGPPLWSGGQSSWLPIQRSGFDSRHYHIFWEVVGLERGPLRLVSTIEELIRSRKPRLRPRWLRDTFYPQKLALTPDKWRPLGQYSSLAD
jgi:hypothetical protein